MSAALSNIVRLMVWTGLAGAGIGPLRAQSEYTTDGVPSALEEEIRWHTNRARFDRTAENGTRGTSYTDIPSSSGPLAPSDFLTLAARHHSEDMARKNKFQHETVPGSTYYNATTQPQPWDRFKAEGYRNYVAVAENISAGNPTAEDAFVAWWKSSGHRVNLGSAAYREIGNGFFLWTAATYDYYYTMDLGARAESFFTETLFTDANGNGKYTQGEGAGNVRVSLRVNGAAHSFYDVSTGAGSFAVPVSTIAQGRTVEVWLTNQNSGPVTLSIPRNYAMLEAMTLAAGESRAAGTIIQPGSGVNYGFRNLVPAAAPVTLPVLTLTKPATALQLSWTSQSGLQYLPQWSAALGGWTDFTGGYQNGTGGVMTQTDAPPAGTLRRFYRVVVRRP